MIAISNVTFPSPNTAFTGSVHTASVVRAAGEGILYDVFYAGTAAPTSVVWDVGGDAQAMTLVKLQQHGQDPSSLLSRYLAQYWLPAPASAKTGTVTTTFAASGNSPVAVYVQHITGHDPALQPRASTGYKTGMSSAAPINDTFTGGAVGDLIVSTFTYRNDSSEIVGSAGGQSAVDKRLIQAGTFSLGSSTKAGAASTTLGYTTVNTTLYDTAHIVTAIQSAAASAPILTSPTGAATGNTTASASVSTDVGSGTAWVFTQLAATAAPSAAAVKAGGTSQAVVATGVQTFAARTGLTPDTLYKNYFVQDDAAPSPGPNTSTVVGSASFRTAGAVSFSGPVPTRNGIVGTVASFTNAGFFAGAVTPFVYTLLAGTLPTGLTLNSSTGVIGGTPTAGGTQSGIIVRATDANSNPADSNAYSIVIAASNAAPTFPGSIANITGTNGVAITPINVSGQFSDTDALTYTASPAGTAWPSGLVVNPSTGIISGTVATSTTTGLMVRATDTAAQTVDSNAFSVTISAAVVGTLTSRPLVNNSTAGVITGPALQVSQAGWSMFVSNLTTGVAVGSAKTTLTTDASAVLPAQTDAAWVAGTTYACRYYNATTGMFGLQHLTAT